MSVGMTWSFDLPDRLKLAIADAIAIFSRIDHAIIECIWILEQADLKRKKQIAKEHAHDAELIETVRIPFEGKEIVAYLIMLAVLPSCWTTPLRVNLSLTCCGSGTNSRGITYGPMAGTAGQQARSAGDARTCAGTMAARRNAPSAPGPASTSPGPSG